MNSISMHGITAWLPAVFAIFVVIISLSAQFRKNIYPLKYTVRILFGIGFIVTFITSSFGGASLKAAKSLIGTNQGVLSAHAWSGMFAVILSILMWILIFNYPGIFSYELKSKPLKLLIFSFALFVISVAIAMYTSIYIG